MAVSRLNTDQILDHLRTLRTRQPVQYSAFYSSQLGGVVTDPALMVIPFDDHMVHRGHGIFDTASLVHGRIYDLDAHLDRFLRSAARSNLPLYGSREQMRDIIIQTTALSARRDGAIRYWLSSGPGSLELSPAAGAEPGFFVMIFAGLSYPDRWYTEGLKVMTTTFPIKPPLYAITKSTNYLPNVLMQMEAKKAGLDNGVFLDESGNVGESSNMNVAFVTQDGVFRHPNFDRILSGCTSLRLLELAPALAAQGLIGGVEVCDIPVADARAAREMMLIGSSIKVASIVEWDGAKIGDGRPGPIAKALLALLDEDMRSGRDRLIDVPYLDGPRDEVNSPSEAPPPRLAESPLHHPGASGPSRDSAMQITERTVGDVTVLDLQGKLTIDDGAALLRDKVASVVFQGQTKVILNLAGVGYMDSGGLGELVRCSMAARKANGAVKLANLTSRITDLLTITKLLTVFDTFDSEEKALASFSA